MRNILGRILSIKPKDDVITIVSGLPRTGTSMMMRMLHVGGMAVVTDNVRTADKDNPRGYFELEKVKKIEEDTSWLKQCPGKAFKMVSELLHYLPEDNKYKVIFMKRKTKEVLASQKKMLGRLGRKGADVSDEEMLALYEKHVRMMEYWISKQQNIDVIYVDYNDVVNRPLENARAVNKFLGGRLDAEKMSKVVEKALYRQRK